MLRSILTLLALVCFVGTLTASDIPYMVNVQGKLTDSGGIPLPDGDYLITFTIYDACEGGDSVWQQTRWIEVKDALFAEILGEDDRVISGDVDLPLDVFNASERCLGIKVSEDPEMIPRQRIVALPYAYYAEQSDYADTSDYAEVAALAYSVAYQDTAGGWVDADDVVHLLVEDDLVGVGTEDPAAKLHVTTEDESRVAVRGWSGDNSGTKYGGIFSAMYEGTTNIGVYAKAGCPGLPCNSAENNIALWALDQSSGWIPMVPSGNWAGVFNGSVKITDSLCVSGPIRFQKEFHGRYSITEGQTLTRTHNLGGDPKRYMVFMYGESSDAIGELHQANYGTVSPSAGLWYGCEWLGLTDEVIKIKRAAHDNREIERDWDYVIINIIRNDDE